MLIKNDRAFPPPPPDIFSKDALLSMPDFVNASPVPLAVPSHPPPAPPPIMKWSLSIANDCVEKDRKKADANNKLISFLIFNIFFSYLIFLY